MLPSAAPVHHNSLVFGDADNDGMSELVAGGTDGSVVVYKDGAVLWACAGGIFECVVCVRVGDVLNSGRNVVLAVGVRGVCRAFDVSRGGVELLFADLGANVSSVLVASIGCVSNKLSVVVGGFDRRVSVWRVSATATAAPASLERVTTHRVPGQVRSLASLRGSIVVGLFSSRIVQLIVEADELREWTVPPMFAEDETSGVGGIGIGGSIISSSGGREPGASTNWDSADASAVPTSSVDASVGSGTEVCVLHGGALLVVKHDGFVAMYGAESDASTVAFSPRARPSWSREVGCTVFRLCAVSNDIAVICTARGGAFFLHAPSGAVRFFRFPRPVLSFAFEDNWHAEENPVGGSRDSSSSGGGDGGGAMAFVTVDGDICVFGGVREHIKRAFTASVLTEHSAPLVARARAAVDALRVKMTAGEDGAVAPIPVLSDRQLIALCLRHGGAAEGNAC